MEMENRQNYKIKQRLSHFITENKIKQMENKNITWINPKRTK